MRKILMAPDARGGEEEIYKKIPNHITRTAAFITYIQD